MNVKLGKRTSFESNAEALAEETGGEVVRVFYTEKTHVWAADLSECEFEGYGVLVRDDWGDEKLL